MAGPYDIRYATEAADDIRGLRAFDRSRVVAAIEQHLVHEPTRLSRARVKRMLQPFWSQYRLRADDFRVYYDVDEPAGVVHVLRVLRKAGGTTPEEKP